MNILKLLLVNLLLLLSGVSGKAQNFHTDGNGIKYTITAQVNGKTVFYISELDGALSCYTAKGGKLWRNESLSPAVLFEIIAADVNGDGNDDVVAASGDGNIYAWGSDGSLLWKFNPGYKVRFNEVAAYTKNGKAHVFAGGNNYLLYELDEKGKLLSETKVDGTIRKIETGNFIEEGKTSIFLMTYSHDKFRWQFFGFLDIDTKETIKSFPLKSAQKLGMKDLTKVMMTDFAIADINHDKKEEILIFGDVSWQGYFAALDGDFNLIASYKADRKEIQRYAHAQGICLAPVQDEVIMRVGSILYVLDSKGNLKHKVGRKYKNDTYCDLAFDANSKTIYTAGDLGGGNGLYAYPLCNKNWYDINHKNIGRYAEVQDNLNSLLDQTLDFKMPDYQKKSDKKWMMISGTELTKEVKKLDGNEIVFIKNKGTFSESTSRDALVEKMGKVALKKDGRKRYDLSQDDIIKRVKAMEASNSPFVLWAGHGNDPFYTRIETLEKILEVAPNTCYGFIYAEMDDVHDPRVIHFIEEYVPRLAKAIRKNNKAKLYFRYKNIFWAATSHLSPWKEMFFSGEYSDILVPASEDTSSRTQDINLAGRVGMHSGGYINDFAMRLIDDNPTSWRPYTPGGQRTVSPYIRQGVLMASYGARYAINFDGLFLEDPAMEILYALMKSGVLPLVEPADILSIGSWHLIKEADNELIHTVDTHHNLIQYKNDDDNAVFSVAQMHWAGASIPEYDFSNAALGVKYRWNNYMPALPNGMVPVAPIESAKGLKSKQVPFFVSDVKHGIVDDKKVEAKDFGKTIKSTVFAGAKKLLMTVEGASWSLIKLDDKHARLILIDPGYNDPQERDVLITIQGQTPSKISDILSKEKVKMRNGQISLKVPAGSMRFIDLEYSKTLN